MPVEYFLRYRGKCYDVGTMIKYKTYGSIHVGTIKWFSHNAMYVLREDGYEERISRVFSLDNTIQEIIIPVELEEPEKIVTKRRNSPPEDDVFYGWICYIAVMIVGTIFNERLTIWVFASLVFFLWKKGFLRGGKK